MRGRFFKNKFPSSSYIQSSIWPRIKKFCSIVLYNSWWNLGNGSHINFRIDKWLSCPIADRLNVHESIQTFLEACVGDFINNGCWLIPLVLSDAYPDLVEEIKQITIPKFEENDHLIWQHLDSGLLSFKDAYSFLNHQNQPLNWCKALWNSFVSPSRSFLVWRIFHNKVPTDDMLKSKGCYIPFVCNISSSEEETTQHLFLSCNFSKALWSWLSRILNLDLNVSSDLSLFEVCYSSCSSQIKHIIIAAAINVFWYIWYSRNRDKFDDKSISVRSGITLISAAVSLWGNCSNGMMSSSLSEVSILNYFSVKGKVDKAPKITEVNWHPPSHGCYKCNTDGSVRGSPGITACGGIFRDGLGSVLGCFSYNIGISQPLYAEITSMMIAFEMAYKKGWKKIWLESDSSTVVAAFKSCSLVPWKLRNRWKN